MLFFAHKREKVCGKGGLLSPQNYIHDPRPTVYLYNYSYNTQYDLKKSKFYAKQQFRKKYVVNHLECAIFIGEVVHR